MHPAISKSETDEPSLGETEKEVYFEMGNSRFSDKGGIMVAILPRLLEIEKERDLSLLKPFSREKEEKAAIKAIPVKKVRKKTRRK